MPPIRTRKQKLHAPLYCHVCKKELKMGDKYTAKSTGFEKCLECSGKVPSLSTE